MASAQIQINSVVTHKFYPNFVGIVVEVHEKFGFLIGWKHLERSGQLTRHKPEHIVAIEDAATITTPAALDAGEFSEQAEMAFVDAGEFDGDPKELSLSCDHREEDGPEFEADEQPGEIIEEAASSEPLASEISEESDEFEEVEDDG